MKKIVSCFLCISFITLISFASSSASATSVPSEVYGAQSGDNKDSLNYPVLKDIEEPEIITIEPKLKVQEDHVEEELVIIDLPPLTDESQKENKTAKKQEKKNLEPSLKVSEGVTTTVSNKTQPETSPDNLVSPKKGNVPERIETVQEEEIIPEENNIVPSRSVTMKRREHVDITYPGSGWIFMGITDGSKDMSYLGRALGTKDTTFTLQARVPGSKILHFYKTDYLTGDYIDDYIEVIILSEEGSNKTHVTAPEYKQPVPKSLKNDISSKKNDGEINKTEQADLKPKETVFKQSDKTNKTSTYPDMAQLKNKDVTTDTSDFTEGLISYKEYEDIPTPEENTSNQEKSDVLDCNALLKESTFLYNEKEYVAALDKINLYLDNATSDIDKGLLLKGQIMEAKSDLQDVKEAIKIYNTLMKEYPASLHWEEANKRVIYLKRFYLEVR